MTRVAFVSDAAYEGGAERYLERLAGGLADRGFAPILVLPDRPELAHLFRRLEARGLPTRRVPAAHRSTAERGWAVRRLLEELRPDLVHLNFPSPYELGCGAWAALARQAGARRIVATEHIADIPASRRRALVNRLTRLFVDRVITISRQHARLLVKRHGLPSGRLRVVYNGVEDPGLPPPRPPGFQIVCVGALEPRKGQDLLIEILPALRERHPAARLTLVGDGPWRGRLEEEVRRRGLEESVTFTGTVESAMGSMMTADVLAVPSRIEGLPFVLMEGMAAGAVVVASALPGLDEAIEHGQTGLLLPPGTRAPGGNRCRRWPAIRNGGAGWPEPPGRPGMIASRWSGWSKPPSTSTAR